MSHSASVAELARSGRAGQRGVRLAAALVALAACWAVVAPAQAQARAGLATGFADPLYLHADPEVRDAAFQRTVASGSQIVRFNLLWRSIAPNQPLDPRNPADPAILLRRL